MPLTDLIEEELLATLDGEGDPQVVLDRHSGSKGPLYAALARATAQATTRFGEVRGKVRQAQTRLRKVEEGAAESDKRARHAERRASAAEKRLTTVEGALARRQALIDRADALRAMGLGEDALAGLGEALARAAQAEGQATAEVVVAFLDAAADWHRLAELRAQVTAAEQRAVEAEKQAKARIAEARLTQDAVKAGRWLAQRKISGTTVETWRAIAGKLGVSAEDLAAGLARALEEHGSLEAVQKAWSAAVAKLRSVHARLTAEVAALRRERDGLGADIDTVRDAGIAEVQKVSNTAAGEVRRAAAEFERLTADAAELRQDVDFAKALRVGAPAQWQRVQPDAWQGILLRLEQWSEGNLANPEVPLPETVAKQAKGSKDYPALYGPLRVPLRGLVAWLRAGVAAAGAEPMRALLAAGATRPPGNAG